MKQLTEWARESDSSGEDGTRAAEYAYEPVTLDSYRLRGLQDAV